MMAILGEDMAGEVVGAEVDGGAWFISLGLEALSSSSERAAFVFLVGKHMHRLRVDEPPWHRGGPAFKDRSSAKEGRYGRRHVLERP